MQDIYVMPDILFRRRMYDELRSETHSKLIRFPFQERKEEIKGVESRCSFPFGNPIRIA